MNNKLPNSQEPKKSNDEEKPTYKIGYKKPPVPTQFKKGRSGNKKGRPKGAKNKPKDNSNTLNDLILKEGLRNITIREGDKTQEVSMINAILKSVSMKAVKGNHRSQKLFFTLFSAAEEDHTHMKQLLFEEAMHFKKCAFVEIEEAKEKNLPEPNIFPHPNHIKINVRTGEVKFIGPLTEEEKENWDHWVARKLNWQKCLRKTRQLLDSGFDLDETELLSEVTKKYLLEDIEFLEELLDIVRKFMPDDIYIPPSTMEYCNSNPDLTIPELISKSPVW